ncbi:MAG: TRAP transporter TatT component family protein [Pseudomonadota bacterium]
MKVGLGGAACVLGMMALAGCSPRQMVMERLADGLAAQGQSTEEDLELAREASAFYLKLSESVLGEQPGHLALAESVAAGFTQYAYAFVAFEAERVEERNLAEAERLRQRAARLYRRARNHAMGALEQAHPGLLRALAGPPEGWPALGQSEVGLAYWAAAAWGGWISLSKDNPEVVADLPLAARLARLAWQSDPAWGRGSLTGLLATFEGARPGGSRAQALAWFDQAIAQSGGRSPGALVAKAEGVALPAGDRDAFEGLLNQALSLPVTDAPLSLQDQVMRRRAAWLLEKSADLF